MAEGSLRTDDDINNIVEKYADMVYRLALSQSKRVADAEDIFQEVFMRYIARDKPFHSEEHRKAWLIRVTINCSRKLFSSAWFRRTVPLGAQVELPYFDTEEKSDVFDAVMSLPRRYRTVIHLFYYEDLSIAQIGEMLMMKESTIKSQLSRARRMLAEKLKGDFDDE